MSKALGAVQGLGFTRRELAAAFFTAAFFNGIAAHAKDALGSLGLWGALGSGFAQSWVVWLTLPLALRLLLKAPRTPVSPTDIAAYGAMALLLAWPLSDMSWLALTLLAAREYFAPGQNDEGRAGALVALALSIAKLWANVVKIFAGPFLERLDVAVLGFFTGTKSQGNVVFFPDGHDNLMVGWPCTSYANASLALLLWLVVTRSMRPRPVRSEWLYLALVFVSVLALNSIRLALIVRSRAMYVLYHGPFGETLFNALMIAATLAVTAYGLRRELLR